MADPAVRVTACTIVAANYLPAARVLARSYLAHHPGHRFVIEVIDAPADRSEPDSGAQVVGPGALAIDRTEYLRMATAYSVTELATAVKPFLLTALRAADADNDVVIYLDPDIRVFAPLSEIPDLAMQHDIVLTPHTLHPMPRDGREPGEAVIMGTGIFNLGFVACGPGSQPFLDFWATRLRHDAIVDPAQQLFTDQRWVDQVPALFRHTVHRDPGCNIAYWNAHERPLHEDATGTIRTVDESTVKFVHFSGYRPEKPWMFTFHCARKPRVVLSGNPLLRRLCDEYGAELRSSGYAESLDSTPYGFAALRDGTKLTTAMRRLFRAAWIDAELPHTTRETPLETPLEIPPHAFDGTDAFAGWLAGPADRAQQRSGLNRLLMSAWAGRTDLRQAFPHPYAQDAEAFRHWCSTSGVTELGLPSWALPAPSPVVTTEVEEDLGVTMLGYFTAELGLGEMGRLLHEAVQQSGIPVTTVVEEKAVSNRTALDRPATEGDARYGVSLLCVNADQTQVMSEAHPEVFAGKYTIGFWAWELEDFPEWLHSAFAMVDEVWTVSEFCATAIAKHTTKPVRVFPAPVKEIPAVESTEKGYTQFLFAFDFNSVGERKNPWGLIDAFAQAFPDRTDVRLVIKAINGERHPISQERLRMAALDDDRIVLLQRYLSVADLDRLYRDSDCYVSLHRSEGFGLTVAQAMVMGMPVISTDYSGTAEFVDEKTGWPIPYRLVPVGKDCFPYHESAVWAAPDTAAAAAALRQVADDPGEAAARGQAAREQILRTRSMTAAANWVGDALRAAHQTWLARRSTPAVAPAPEIPDPMAPLHDAAEAVRWRADPGTGARNPIAPAVRKAMLRLLDHYDVHQRSMLGEVQRGAEETTRLLLQRIEWLEARMGSTGAHAQSAADRSELVDRRTGQIEAQLRDLRHRAPGVDLALRNLERDVTALQSDAADRDDALAATRAALHDALAERDRRADSDEHVIGELNRQWSALAEAARLRHAPLPPGTDVVLCDAGALLLPDDNVIAPWLRHHRSWERTESELMATLAGGGVFLDVGAHVGYHSLALWRRLGTVAGIVAVEADPGNAALLRRNIAVNLPAGAAALVTVIEAAAWDSDTTVAIGQVEEGNSGDIRVRPGDGVPAVRLDGQAAVTAARVGLVKTDLQGRDHRAFAGLAGVIERDRPHFLVEYSPEAIDELGDDPVAVLRAYRAAGYALVPVGDQGPEDPTDGVEELCARARAQESGLLTVWLRP